MSEGSARVVSAQNATSGLLLSLLQLGIAGALLFLANGWEMILWIYGGVESSQMRALFPEDWMFFSGILSAPLGLMTAHVAIERILTGPVTFWLAKALTKKAVLYHDRATDSFR